MLCRCGVLSRGKLRIGHVLHKLHLLLRSLNCLSRRCSHHHQSLPWLQPELRHVGVILELAALDEDLLSFRLDVCEGVEECFEDFAGLGQIGSNVVLLASVFNDD